MARFYKTGETDFLEYSTDVRPEGVDVSSIFGKLEALPEDRARLEELVGGFDTEINDLATTLQRNPSSLRSLQPRIGSLRRNLRDNLQFGEIKAIQDRYKQYQDITGGIRKTLKDEPFLADQAIKRIQVEDLGFDPDSRSFGRVNAPDVVAPFTADKKRAFRETAENVIKDRILSKVSDTTPLNDVTSLLEVGEIVGVSRDQVIDSLIGQVTPDMIRAEEQELRFRGMDEEADKAAKFFDPVTRKFDLSTTYGSMLNSMVEALSRSKFQGTRTKVDDKSKLERLKASLRNANAKFKSGLKKKDAKFLAEKLVGVWSGLPEAFDQEKSGVGTSYREDNFLQGLKTADDLQIQGIKKEFGKPPVVIVQKLDESGNPTGDAPQERLLDIEFMESIEGFDFGDNLSEELQKLDAFNKEARDIDVDPTQDADQGPPPIAPPNPTVPGLGLGKKPAGIIEE